MEDRLIGKKFGVLTVEAECEPISGVRMFMCTCACGNKVKVSFSVLLRTKSISCGCLKIKHGIMYSKKPALSNIIKNEFSVKSDPLRKLKRLYLYIKHRCYNKKCDSYRYYGAMGVTMCEEWLKSKAAFVEFCLSHGYEEGLQIDRIDTSKGYSPENCRFVTAYENLNNRRNSKWWVVNGKKYDSLQAASIGSGMSKCKITYRCNQGKNSFNTIPKYPGE